MRSVFPFLVFLLLALSPVQILAHGNGASFEQQTDTYFIDVGYDVPLRVGEETLLDFALYTLKNDEPDTPASYSSLSIRISSGSTVLLERSINKPEFGRAIANLIPSEGGNWTLEVSFVTSGTVLETSAFDVDILPAFAPEYSQRNTVLRGIVILLVLSALTTVAILKRRK